MRTNDISPVVRCTYWLARFVILRLLGLVYLVAFLTAAKQIVPLIGAKGLLPVGQFLARVRKSLGSTQAGLIRRPSLFWWNHSDAALLATAWTGVALSAVVLCGWSNALVLAALWLLYMSFVHAGQNWYGYGGKCSCWRRDSSRFFFVRSWMAGRCRGVRRLSSSHGCSGG